MGFAGGFEWLIIVLVIILLFGARRIPEMARGIGKGISEFRRATEEGKEELEDKQKESNS